MVTPASSASQVPAGGEGIEAGNPDQRPAAENPDRIGAAGAGSAWRDGSMRAVRRVGFGTGGSPGLVAIGRRRRGSGSRRAVAAGGWWCDRTDWGMVEVFAFVCFFQKFFPFFFVLLFGVRSATLRCLVLRAYFFPILLFSFFLFGT